jgi:hypothetical protein
MGIRIQANYTPLWSVPLGWANLGEDFRELNKKLIEDIETERELDNSGRGGTFGNSNNCWQSQNTMEHRYESFAQLVPSIARVAQPVMHKSGLPKDVTANVANLWANVVFNRGGYSFPHTHGVGDTLWSGVYYPKGLHDIENLDELDVTETFAHGVKNDGGILVLRDSNVSKELIEAETDTPHWTYDRNFSVIPRESLLVLFPCWLEHMVTPTQNDDKRYSISFGIFRHSQGLTADSATTRGWATSDANDNFNDEVTIEKE